MEKDWLILRTKTFREKVAESYLTHKQVTCFLPIRKKPSRAGAKRPLPAEFPLFPGYIFVQPDVSCVAQMRFVPGTFGMLVHNGKPATIAQSEIDRIRGISGCEYPVESHPSLLVGKKVRIIHGSLAGVVGDLVRLKNQMRLVINILLLNQSVSVEIDSNWLEPA